MTSQGMSRKQPAPGSAQGPYQQMQNLNVNMPNSTPSYNGGLNNGMGTELSNDQFLQWGLNAQPSNNADQPVYPVNPGTFQQVGPQTSTQLTRRPMAQLTSRARLDGLPNQPYLDGIPDTGGTVATEPGWQDDIKELEAKAQVAKREAQSKRKQIPPFVQKLNSFLEDGRNTELIRWSDDGNSFIVLDEDEFAKTLIPELFKHNNYASFVRQLNMYGFHKKVGLSDNSMRASERKNKSPSEYSNPFFRRGHPDLLWLIQKPKNAAGTAGKRKGKGDNDGNDEDADDYVEDVVNTAPDTRVRAPGRLSLGEPGEGALTQEQFQSVQRELAAIRHQQAQISRMMQSIRREHEQLYGQAASFQDQHNRHENSINAILTFLATVYNRSLQGHEGVQGIANIFANAMPVDSSQGNVVDVGDYTFDNPNLADAGLPKPFKKQPLLLTNGTPQDRAQTVSPRPSNSPYARNSRFSSQTPRNASASAFSPAIEEVFDPGVNSPTQNIPPPSTSAHTTALPQRDMMSVIQSANARSPSSTGTPTQDFSNVLSSLESSSNPLSLSQRADMLRLIHNSAGGRGGDNALVNATPPPGPPNFSRKLASTSADLDHLAKLQAEQDKSVQNLANLLQPLSPTGSIPGIGDGQSFGPPPLDIDDFLNHNEYFTDFPSDGNGNYDFGQNNDGVADNLNFGDFKNDGAGADDDELFANLPDNGTDRLDNGDSNDDYSGGRVESVASSEVTTPKEDHGDSYKIKPGRKLSSGESGAAKRRRRS